jgi:hypothetical protein
MTRDDRGGGFQVALISRATFLAPESQQIEHDDRFVGVLGQERVHYSFVQRDQVSLQGVNVLCPKRQQLLGSAGL